MKNKQIVDEAMDIADELLAASDLDSATRISVRYWIQGHIPVSTTGTNEPELNQEMFIELVYDAIKNKKGNPVLKSGSKQTANCVIRDKHGNIKFQETSELEIINGNSN